MVTANVSRTIVNFNGRPVLNPARLRVGSSFLLGDRREMRERAKSGASTKKARGGGGGGGGENQRKRCHHVVRPVDGKAKTVLSEY